MGCDIFVGMPRPPRIDFPDAVGEKTDTMNDLLNRSDRFSAAFSAHKRHVRSAGLLSAANAVAMYGFRGPACEQSTLAGKGASCYPEGAQIRTSGRTGTRTLSGSTPGTISSPPRAILSTSSSHSIRCVNSPPRIRRPGSVYLDRRQATAVPAVQRDYSKPKAVMLAGTLFVPSCFYQGCRFLSIIATPFRAWRGDWAGIRPSERRRRPLRGHSIAHRRQENHLFIFYGG
jgi:hypothetical protein